MLRSAFPRLALIPALEIAGRLGSVRVVNVVMIGALSNHLSWEADLWRNSIRSLVKPQFVDLNLRALDAGRAAQGGN